MRHGSKQSDASLKIAGVFFTCIVLLLLGGLLLKLFLLLHASTFDGTHQFIVEVDQSKQKGVIVAFNPSSSSVTALYATGQVPKTFGKYLGIPIDASMNMAVDMKTSELVGHMFFNGKNEKGLTIIDKLRLLLFVNSLKPTNFHDMHVSLPLSSEVSDRLLPTLFLDNTLYTDNESVAVINATNESGVGADVAKMLGTIGMNVISVTTGQHMQKDTTLVASHTNTYTVSRLKRLFHIEVTQNTSQHISDITLTIGTKSLPDVE